MKINCFIWSPKICAPLPRKVDPTNDAEKFFGDQKLNSLLQKANADQDYIALRDVINRGFPSKQNMLPEELKDFWVFKDELTNFKGFVLLNEKRIVIPAECREDVLKDLHLAHQGVVRMKRRARNTV